MIPPLCKGTCRRAGALWRRRGRGGVESGKPQKTLKGFSHFSGRARGYLPFTPAFAVAASRLRAEALQRASAQAGLLTKEGDSRTLTHHFLLTLIPEEPFFQVFIFPGNRLIHKSMYDHFQIAHLGAITGNWAAELSPFPSPPG